MSIRPAQSIKLGFMIAFLLVPVCTFWSLPAPAKAAAASGDVRSLYVEHCSKCHGTDGRSQTPKGRKTEAPDLTKSTVSDAKGIRLITNGKSDMPAFKDKLSPDDIESVMAFVRGFRR